MKATLAIIDGVLPNILPRDENNPLAVKLFEAYKSEWENTKQVPKQFEDWRLTNTYQDQWVAEVHEYTRLDEKENPLAHAMMALMGQLFMGNNRDAWDKIQEIIGLMYGPRFLSEGIIDRDVDKIMREAGQHDWWKKV